MTNDRLPSSLRERQELSPARQTLPQTRTRKMPLLGARAIGVNVPGSVCCSGVVPMYPLSVRGVVAPVHAGYPLLAVNVRPMKVTLREHFLAVQVGQAMGDGPAAGIGAGRVVEFDPSACSRTVGAMGTGSRAEGRRRARRTGQDLDLSGC